MQIEVRRATSEEQVAIDDLVNEVRNELYGGLLVHRSNTLSEEDWTRAWIARRENILIGVALTTADVLEDLWVGAQHRSCGAGRELLRYAECEIANRGGAVAHLRVLGSNRNAVHFHQHAGWQVVREFPHETLPCIMLEMQKQLTVNYTDA